MGSFLVTHALQNVWCNPSIDNQFIIKLARLTPSHGVINVFKLLRRMIALPEIGKTYHVFQVGPPHPSFFRLLDIKDERLDEGWHSFQHTAITLNTFSDIYNEEGVHFPNWGCFYKFTQDQNLIIAVEDLHKSTLNQQQGDLWWRVYANAWYRQNEATASSAALLGLGGRPNTTNEILNIQTAYQTYIGLSGFTFVWVNGLLVDSLDLITTHPKDVVDIIHDRSGLRIVDYPYQDLPSFLSQVDGVRKYLLHYDGNQSTGIDYHDDIDFYLIKKVGNRYRGIYLHKNTPSSVRMVTHRDYSLWVDRLETAKNYLEAILDEGPLDPSSLFIRAMMRKSGYDRGLEFEHKRIHELYKLDSQSIVDSLTGVTGTLPLWRGESLEASAYVNVMQANRNTIDDVVVQNAYGYNAISKILADTPQPTISDLSLQRAELPIGLQDYATVYEYDQNGYLLGYHFHQNGNQYQAVNNLTRTIEGIVGKGTHRPEVYFGLDNVPHPTNVNCRVYSCGIDIDNHPDNVWEDITGSLLYRVQNQTVIWEGGDLPHFLMVRTDRDFLAYDLYLRPENGVLYFTLSEMEDRGGGVDHYTLPLPLGEFDLFLNGKSLQYGLDWECHFPEIVILNKKYLTDHPNTEDQWVHVRATGFCQSNLTFEIEQDQGFIVHEVLSKNNRFDLRDDKVLRIVVDGALKKRTEVYFSEEHTGVSIVNAVNGKPYSIRDIVVPIRNLVSEETYSFREKSKQVDSLVGNYMSLKHPEYPRNAVSAIQELYPIYSPFFASVIDGLWSNEITDEVVDAAVNDTLIISALATYERWLPYDPVQIENQPDARYVVIHPHLLPNTIPLTQAKYRFLVSVVRLYGKGLINLSPFVVIQ